MPMYELIIILALTGYAVYRQTRTHEVTAQGRFRLALIYAVVGVSIGFHFDHTAASLGLLAISLLASLLVGLVRGTRTLVWRADDGRILSRGTVLTVGLFLALIAFKFALGTAAYFAHIPYGNDLGEILLMIGVMVAGQAEITWRRAQRLGAGSEPAAAPAFAGRH